MGTITHSQFLAIKISLTPIFIDIFISKYLKQGVFFNPCVFVSSGTHCKWLAGRKAPSRWWRTGLTNSNGGWSTRISNLAWDAIAMKCMRCTSKGKHVDYVSDLQISAARQVTLLCLLRSQSDAEVHPQKGYWGEQHSLLTVFEKKQLSC